MAPATEAHHRAAFAAMAWAGWTYEEAMADPLRSRLVKLRACQLRNTEHRRASRIAAAPPHAMRPAAFDCKRAAAGDRDD